MANEWIAPLTWENAGTAPSDNLKTKGFEAGYKPPAAVFNYFLHKEQECIEQLQNAVDSAEKKIDQKADEGHTHKYAGSSSAGGAATSALTANKATQDAEGNNIVETYATKGEIPTKVSQLTNDANYKTTDNNTTYKLSKSGETITLTGSDGSKSSVTDSNTNTNTTYSLSKSGATITLTGSDGSTTSVPVTGTSLAAVNAVSTDGITYTGTIDTITELKSGVAIIFIPNRASASVSPTLNLNSFGAKGIRRRLSNLSTSTQEGYASTWLAANKAFLLVYDGTYWIVDGLTKPAAADLYGTLAVEKGGTGATTAAAALANLGITATAAELNKMDGVTATTAELNYVDGVTSNIQTQLNGKAKASHTHTVSDVSGTLPLSKGGTGATTAASALTNLGAASATDLEALLARIVALEKQLLRPVVGEYWFNDTMVWLGIFIQETATVRFVADGNSYFEGQAQFEVSDGNAIIVGSDGFSYTIYDELDLNYGMIMVDFGSTPQLVSREFHDWLIANTTRGN